MPVRVLSGLFNGSDLQKDIIIMLAFALAVFFLIITPGPGVLSTAGVGSAFGYKAGIRYVLGLLFGTNLVCFAVISGIAAAIFSVPLIRIILFGLSTGYLFYLAARIAFAGANLSFIEARKCPGIGSGILLQLINPKAYAVNTALFASFHFSPESFLFEIGAKLAIMNTIWLPLHLIWLSAGVRLHRLNLSAKIQRRINIAMAVSLVIVVCLAVSSILSEYLRDII